MPRWGPIGRRDLVAALRTAGFTGPHPGGRHGFMVRNDIRVIIPNPHRSEIGLRLLSAVLRQAGISREEWEAL